MAKFYYHSTKSLDPRPGKTFSTTYYRQNIKEFDLVKAHVQQIGLDLLAVFENNPETDWEEWCHSPLKGFSTTTKGKPNYSLIDIVQDLLAQIVMGKDIPSGMIGRWNRLFKDTPWDIELEQGEREKNNFVDIFNPNAGKQ
jgi:hypothetical protein